MNIKQTKIGIFAILVAFFMLCSLSASFAGSYGSDGFRVENGEANDFVQLSTNKKVYLIDEKKVPKKYRKYGKYYFKVPKGKKIKYKATIKTAGNGLVYNLRGIKVKAAYINFGDKYKKKTTGWITHTYKRTGWYKLTIRLNGVCTGFSSMLTENRPVKAPGIIKNGAMNFLVYVDNKPQLEVSKISSGYFSYKQFKKKNIDFLDIRITNAGSRTSKTTKLKMWYEKTNEFGKVHPKLKKYTKTAKIKALKAGQSTNVRIYFKIPKKFSKLWKNIRLDYLNRVNLMSRPDTLQRFR